MGLFRKAVADGGNEHDLIAMGRISGGISGELLTPSRTAVTREELLDRLGQQQSASSALLFTLACVIVIRALIFIVGVISTDTATSFGMYATGHAWIAFDSEHYLQILRDGYPSTAIPPEIAFFPLLPILGRSLGLYLSPETSLVVISNLATIIGFGFFFEWTRSITNRRTAFWACLLLATFPTSAFFSGALTEGPFMMCVAIVLLMLQRQSYFIAALVCGLATALRPTALPLAITLLLWVWLQHLRYTNPQLFERGGCPSWTARLRQAIQGSANWPLIRRLILLGAISTAGISTYQYYLWQRYDRFDVYFQAQTYWQPGGLRTAEQLRLEAAQEAHAAWEASIQHKSAQDSLINPRLRALAGKALTPQAWNRGMMWGIVVLTIIGLARTTRVRRELFALSGFIFLMAYLPAWGERASSVARYETAALPCFALLAIMLLSLKRPAVLSVIVAAQLLMQVYYAILFSRGVWIG